MRALNNSYSCRHHLDFLTKCSKDHLTPKGLRLHLRVNVNGSNHSQLDRNIATVLKTAESDILTLIADHYRDQGDAYHREANTLKQRMESLAGKLPDKERQQHNQEVDFTERRAQIRTREQETTRMKKHMALHHETLHNLMPVGQHLLPKGQGPLPNQIPPWKQTSPSSPTQSPHSNYGAVVFQRQRARLERAERVFRRGGIHPEQIPTPTPPPQRGNQTNYHQAYYTTSNCS